MTICFTISLIFFPEEALSASLRGLNMWLQIVFPSLLPFFITAELLIAFGVVKFLGVLFEPVMRPLFNVPGAGSFGWMMGMVSGYPIGAKIAARLREEGQLSRIEAERLVSFTNNSSPLFIFGAISVGLFQNAAVGFLLAVCHYTSNIFVGIFMRFYKFREEKTSKGSNENMDNRPLFLFALRKMHETRMEDNRPFGKILGDAVLQSIRTLIMVGGFIILFSVVVEMLRLVDFSVWLGKIFGGFFSLIGISDSFGTPFFSGLFEITIGATLITAVETDTLLSKLVLVSFILGFNGFSIQAQVASILAWTDIRFRPYLFARVLHGTIAAVMTMVLYKPLFIHRMMEKPADIPASAFPDPSILTQIFNHLMAIGPWLTLVALWCGFLLHVQKKLGKQ